MKLFKRKWSRWVDIEVVYNAPKGECTLIQMRQHIVTGEKVFAHRLIKKYDTLKKEATDIVIPPQTKEQFLAAVLKEVENL